MKLTIVARSSLHGGGGGGRIAIYHSGSDIYHGQLQTFGGRSNHPMNNKRTKGGAGTLFRATLNSSFDSFDTSADISIYNSIVHKRFVRDRVTLYIHHLINVNEI